MLSRKGNIFPKSLSLPFFMLAILASTSILPPRPAVAGEWKTRTVEQYDGASKRLVNRSYKVWDLQPERNLNFDWSPDDPNATYPDSVINGSGTLIWRRRDKPAFDRQSQVSAYSGAMRNGRPDGKGTIIYRSGGSYAGDWRDGVPEGRGVLHGRNGDDYEGEFAAGQMNGKGRYAYADGSVYVGSFRAGQRDGTGTWTTPDGRSFNTVWAAGKLSGTPAAAADTTAGDLRTRPDGLTLRVLIDRPKNQDVVMTEDAPPFIYEAERRPGSMRVVLADKNIMDVWKGDGAIGTGQPLFETEQFAPVFLAADIENRGSDPLHVTDAFLTIVESATDLQPYLQAFNGVSDPPAEGVYEPRIQFRNLGWGEVKNATVDFAFGEGGQRVGSFSTHIGNLGRSAVISADANLQGLGLRIDRMRKRHYTCPSYDALNGCLERVEQAGDLGQLAGRVFLNGAEVYVKLTGRIAYDWTDISGKTQGRTSPVAIDIPLFIFENLGAEQGAPGATEYAGRTVQLQLDRKNYRLPLNWHGDLQPREDKRFAFALVAPKASHHVLRLTVELADGSTANSLLVDLTYFRPSQ